VRNDAYFYKKWLRDVYGLKTRIVKKFKKRIKGMAADKPNGEKNDNIDENKGGDIKKGTEKNTNENKGGGIKRGIKGNTDEETNKKPLFKKKFTILLRFKCLRPRPLPPRLRNAVLPVKIIRFKKELIKNKTKRCNNARKIRSKYANKIKNQNNV